VNKKTLISILSGAVLVLPAIAAAASSLGDMAGKLKSNLLLLGIPLATIGFVIVGFVYVSASANPSKMAAAKEGLVAVIIGVVILILAAGAYEFVNGLFF